MVTPKPTVAAFAPRPPPPPGPPPPCTHATPQYWYEVQRMFWHAKLGNLVLLPAKTAGSGSGHGAATADYEGRAALWRQAGVASALPGFSGPLVAEGGRYSRFRFAFDECRVRHADMLGRLVEVFEL